MEGTLPPSCKNHGANIGSVRYRQAAMRVIEQRIAARHAEILAVLATSAASTSSAAAPPHRAHPDPLWSIAVRVAQLDNQDTARRHLAATASELNWALQLTGRITQVQNALTGPS